MLSISEALEIVLRCIKAIAGKAEPSVDPHHTLDESGISTNHQVRPLKSELIAELAIQGLELRKMSLDNIIPSSTIYDVAYTISHAQPKGEKLY